MRGPPPAQPPSDTVSRGSRKQQPRAFDGGNRVRVVGDDDILLDVCAPDQLGRYLTAPNAEVKRRKDGSVRLIRLLSMGDDRGHLGENHGRSTVTTERVRKESGAPPPKSPTGSPSGGSRSTPCWSRASFLPSASAGGGSSPATPSKAGSVPAGCRLDFHREPSIR